MSRLSLSETCLLDVSGELGRKAKVQLQEHVAKYPAALLEYELTRSQFELLRSMPKVELDEVSRQRIGEAIKRGIHEKLRQRERDARARKLRKIMYHAMAGVSGIAAVLVIAFSIKMTRAEAERREVALAASHINEYLSTDSTNQTDADLNDVAMQVSALENTQVSLATPESGSLQAVSDLINNVDNSTNDPEAPGAFQQ
jgi:hypothetical protein